MSSFDSATPVKRKAREKYGDEFPLCDHLKHRISIELQRIWREKDSTHTSGNKEVEIVYWSLVYLCARGVLPCVTPCDDNCRYRNSFEGSYMEQKSIAENPSQRKELLGSLQQEASSGLRKFKDNWRKFPSPTSVEEYVYHNNFSKLLCDLHPYTSLDLFHHKVRWQLTSFLLVRQTLDLKVTVEVFQLVHDTENTRESALSSTVDALRTVKTNYFSKRAMEASGKSNQFGLPSSTSFTNLEELGNGSAATEARNNSKYNVCLFSSVPKEEIVKETRTEKNTSVHNGDEGYAYKEEIVTEEFYIPLELYHEPNSRFKAKAANRLSKGFARPVGDWSATESADASEFAREVQTPPLFLNSLPEDLGMDVDDDECGIGSSFQSSFIGSVENNFLDPNFGLKFDYNSASI